MNSKKKKPYNARQREIKIAQMEELLGRLNEHSKYLAGLNRKWRKIESDLKKLEDYYISEWMDDYDNFDRRNHYLVLLQDPIYNLLQEIHVEKIKLLQSIVKNLK